VYYTANQKTLKELAEYLDQFASDLVGGS